MWELFGESDQRFRVVSAVRNPGSGLEVFGLAEDGSVLQNVESTPSIDDWTGWSPVGRRPVLRRLFPDRSSPGFLSLGVNTSYAGLLRVFGVARDGSAWTNGQTFPYRSWQGWRRFGVVAGWRRRFSAVSDGWLRFGVVSAGLREVVVPSNDLTLGNTVFGLGVDDTVWINLQYDPYQPQGWHGWQEFGDEALLLSSLVVGRPDDLTIEAIGIASDNTVWRNSAHVWELDQWSGWQPFGAPNDQFRAVTALRTGIWDGSESDVFALALDDTIWRRAPGSNAWARFGDPDDRLSTITPIWNVNGLALGVAGTGPDDTIWHAALLPSGQWGPLDPFGSSGDQLRQLTFGRGNDYRMHAFGTAPDGTVWHKSQTEPGTWPPP
ncbi:MAG TPA: hypothetical protein VK306_14255 [Acidimicrobiales bacterium]|nr:hypothetical protein [Acidimicrobiales bacterium]